VNTSALLAWAKGIGAPKLLSLIALAAVVIGICAAITMKLAAPNMSVLYSNLDMKDSGAIVSDLEAQGIPYELRANGSQVMVPESKVLRLRVTMAQKGLPIKGSLMGYEIFDQSESLGSSSFQQNINLLRALEGELARTISSLQNVDSARVHLVMPKRELFMHQRQEPSASVVIGMRRSQSLNKGEISAISNLVATAVPGLNLARITIVDTQGRPLKLGTRDENDIGSVAATTEEYRINYENRLRNTLEEILEQSIGTGKVKVQVSADINFDRVVTNSEIYDPDGQVVRSLQSETEKDSSTESQGAANNVSVNTNLPDRGGAGGGSNAGIQSGSATERTNETTNYEITKTVKNQISETGTVRRLSIAVLVDGNYNVDKKTGDVTYTPRTPEEITKLTALVKSSSGFRSERGDNVEIVNMQFTNDLTKLRPESLTDWAKAEVGHIAQTFIVSIVIILIILLVVRPVAIRAFEMTKGELEDVNNLEMAVAASQAQAQRTSTMPSDQEDMIDIDRLDAKVKSGARKSVNDVVEKYPQETLAILRRWFNEEI
jgi:flagellar M-ring protein FliF